MSCAVDLLVVTLEGLRLVTTSALSCKGTVMHTVRVLCVSLEDFVIARIDTLATNRKLFFIIIAQLSGQILISTGFWRPGTTLVVYGIECADTHD